MKTKEQVIKELKLERDELIAKAERLEDFLGRDNANSLVGDVQYVLMECQLKYMRCYIDVLDKRILDFGGYAF